MNIKKPDHKINLIWLFLFYNLSAQAEPTQHVSCLLVKKDSQLYADTEKKQFIAVKANRILPVFYINQNTKMISTKMLGRPYFISMADVNFGPAKLCSSVARCFTLKKKGEIRDAPNIDAPIIGEADRGSAMDWIGQRTPKGSIITWHEVKIGDNYGWIDGESGVFEDKFCEGSTMDQHKKWSMQVEVSQMSKIPSSTYQTLITAIDNPNFVNCDQNPIVENIIEGKGQSVAVQFDYEIFNWLQIRSGIGYQKKIYTLNLLQNPHPSPGSDCQFTSPVAQKDLTATQDTITENNLTLPLGFYGRYQINDNNKILLGTNLYVNSFIPPGYDLISYSGNTFKQTQKITSISPKNIRFMQDIEIRYQYNHWTENNYLLGLSLFYKKHLPGEDVLGLSFHF